jgi:hypothetical protein
MLFIQRLSSNGSVVSESSNGSVVSGDFFCTTENQKIYFMYRKLGYFGRSFILVYLVPLLKMPKLNTPKNNVL